MWPGDGRSIKRNRILKGEEIMLNKGQLFKDVMVILLIIWVVIVSICIIDIYS